MNKVYGPAIISCVKQNDKFSFDGLGRLGYHSEFQTLARDISISWHQIYYAEYITEKHCRGDLDLIKWLIIHLLYQSGSGHLRSDFNNFDESIDSWFFIEGEYFPGSDSDLIER